VRWLTAGWPVPRDGFAMIQGHPEHATAQCAPSRPKSCARQIRPAPGAWSPTIRQARPRRAPRSKPISKGRGATRGERGLGGGDSSAVGPEERESDRDNRPCHCTKQAPRQSVEKSAESARKGLPASVLRGPNYMGATCRRVALSQRHLEISPHEVRFGRHITVGAFRAAFGPPCESLTQSGGESLNSRHSA
jgi:hypothetical protein